MERYVRGTTKIYKNVYVCTGPLYLPHAESDGKNYVKYQVIGTNNVAVPTHFFKILVGETADLTLEMEAYVLPNKAISDDTALASFMVRIQCIKMWELLQMDEIEGIGSVANGDFLWSFYPFGFLTYSLFFYSWFLGIF